MKIRQLYFLYILVACTLGCKEKTRQIPTSTDAFDRSTVTINFSENIVSTDPYLAKSSSERFIRDLVYDKIVFFNSAGIIQSNILTHWTIDSLNNVLCLYINKNNHFQDGSQVQGSDIFELFKELLEKKEDETNLKPLFSMIEGYALTRWYRENRNISNFVPAGLSYTDSTFSIKLNGEAASFLQRMAASDRFYLQKDKLGSGEFQITEADDDITYVLSRAIPDTSGIQHIRIQFLKNQEEIVRNFVDGNLDIIKIHSSEIMDNYYHDYLQKLVTNPYPDYTRYEADQAWVTFAVGKNFPDSTSLDIIDNKLIINNIYSIINPNDTTIELTYVDKRRAISRSIELPDYLIESKLAPKDQSEIWVELKDTLIDYQGQAYARIEEQLVGESPNSSMATSEIAIISVDPYYYFTKHHIGGFSDNQKLSNIVKDITFVTPKTY